MNQSAKKQISVKALVYIAVLGAMSAVLMVFKFPLPFAPPFMTVDIGDVGVMVSGFAFGPLAGVVTALVKILINLLINGTTTGGVGELSNFIISSTFVIIASLIYRRNKTKKNAILGLALGVLAYTAIACLSNYFVIFPLYGIDIKEFAKEFAAVNSLVSNSITFILFSIVPFNLVKGFLTSLVTIILYKPLSRFMKSNI
ncbi:MAG: ECF transporter S component [Finegoldia sp.]|nr:ECF transporter S component [Finegoldia sp.]